MERGRRRERGRRGEGGSSARDGRRGRIQQLLAGREGDGERQKRERGRERKRGEDTAAVLTVSLIDLNINKAKRCLTESISWMKTGAACRELKLRPLCGVETGWAS